MAGNRGAEAVDIIFQEVIGLYERGSLIFFRCECDPSCDGPVHVQARGTFGLNTVGDPVIRRDTYGTSLRTRKEVRIIEISVPVRHLIFGCRLTVSVGAARGQCEISRKQAQAALSHWRKRSEDASNWSGYDGWVRTRCPETEQEREREAAKEFSLQPLISIVTPVYRTPARYLKDLLDSIEAQTYTNWEHVIVNVSGECPEVDEVLSSYADPRIRIIMAPNKNISENTNPGIAAALGDYIAFVDHDDFLEPDALFRYVQSINEYPDVDLLFCNEDLYRDQDGQEQMFYGARFKPGWNPDLLFGCNYACHMLCVSRHAIEHTERSGADVAGAQDYDLTFKVSEIARSIVHVPYLLYHWRDHAGSTATRRDTKPYALEAGRLSIQRHLDRRGIASEVSPAAFPFSYRVRYKMPDGFKASVVVVAPSGDGIFTCIDAIRSHAQGYIGEIIVCGPQADKLPKDIDNVRKVPADSRSWPALANRGAREASGDIVVFVDEHCRVQDDDWLEATAEYLMRPEVGCAAPMAVYPDHTICSAGGMVAADGSLTSLSRNLPEVVDGYMIIHKVAHDCSVVPPILLALRRSDFERMGGFVEELSASYAVANLCLSFHEEGKICAVQPFSRAVCREISAGRPPLGAAQECELLVGRHPWIKEADLYADPAIDRKDGYIHTRFMNATEGYTR